MYQCANVPMYQLNSRLLMRFSFLNPIGELLVQGDNYKIILQNSSPLELNFGNRNNPYFT